MIDFCLDILNNYFMQQPAKTKSYVTGAPSKVRSKSKKLQLLDAGLELFAKKGLNGTTIRDIAKLSGVNSSMISYHYKNKQGLYKSCIQYIGETQLKFLPELLTPAKNKTEYKKTLETLAQRLIQNFTENKYSGMLLIKEFDLAHSPAEDAFNSIFSNTFDSLTQFFKQAQKQKIISADKDGFTLTSFCIGLLFSQLRLDYIKNKVYGKSLKDPEQRTLFTQHFVYSLT